MSDFSKDLCCVSGGPDATKDPTNKPSLVVGRLNGLKALEARVVAKNRFLPASVRGNSAFRDFAEGTRKSIQWDGYRLDVIELPKEYK